jgi:hypothetical protein
VHVGAILTGIERRLLGACPIFGYSAPQPRTGKSKLAESVAILATGKPAPATAVSPAREEFRKALFSALREGFPITNLDNLEYPLRSADLSKIITQGEFADRVLGQSHTLHLPTNVLWTSTGNNLSFRGDLANRVVICRIDAGEERPEQRTFTIPDLEAHLLEHRAELIGAGLTILRAYHLAGCPEQNLSKWGGFDHWSKFIREPLVWAGMSDPCLTREDVLDDDPEREAASAVFQQLREHWPDGFFVRDVIDTANDIAGKAWAYPELHDALVAVTGGNKNIDAAKLGYWLRAWRDRYVDGMKLIRMKPEGGHANAAEWRVQ